MGVYSGNRTLLGESAPDVVAGHIMELALEAQRNDLNMFNAVINLDFTEAYNEAGIAILTEEQVEDAKKKTKDGIVKKIKELLKTIAAKIKTAVANFIAKVKNLIANDSKLIAKYKGYMDASKLEGITLSSYRPLKEYDPIAEVEAADKTVNKVCKVEDIDKLESVDDINKHIEDGKKVMKDTIEKITVEDLIFDGDSVEDYNITEGNNKNQIKLIFETVRDSKFLVDALKQTEKASLEVIKRLEADLKLQKRNTNDTLEIAKLNAKYKECVASSQFVSKLVNIHMNAVSRRLAAARKAFVQLGSKAEKKANGGSVSESAVYEYCLGEASDAYVEAALLTI